MTQRVFDVENEKDMVDLWDILPDDVEKIEIEEANGYNRFCYKKVGACEHSISSLKLIAINWHDKREIIRPIPEVTEYDIGKICMFFNSLSNSKYYGVLVELRETVAGTRYVAQSCNGTHPFVHARRLTKQEIEELI